MASTTTDNVLTLQEMAKYLKIPQEKIEKQVLQGKIPGRKIEDEWRFLKAAVDEWLGSSDTRMVLIGQSGALSDDENLDELREAIYAQRGRRETEDFDD
jgi:excisionase family DNA binding protein